MSNLTVQTVYIADTSALMDWHDRFYPPDVFGSLVRLIDGIVNEGRFLTAELVHDEINAMGSAGLQAWAKGKAAMFDPTVNHLAAALAIEGAYPALKDPRAQHTEADAYVIALAQMRNAVVITAETPAAHKRKPRRSLYIPDVCSMLGIACISNLGMMRREGWQL